MVGHPEFNIVAEFRDLPVTNLKWGTERTRSGQWDETVTEEESKTGGRKIQVFVLFCLRTKAETSLNTARRW